MSQSLVQIYVHLVFSTSDRVPFLQDVPFREKVYAYLAGICNRQDCPALIVGGVADHVHILCRLGKQIEVSNLIREIGSSRNLVASNIGFEVEFSAEEEDWGSVVFEDPETASGGLERLDAAVETFGGSVADAVAKPGQNIGQTFLKHVGNFDDGLKF